MLPMKIEFQSVLFNARKSSALQYLKSDQTPGFPSSPPSSSPDDDCRTRDRPPEGDLSQQRLPAQVCDLSFVWQAVNLCEI